MKHTKKRVNKTTGLPVLSSLDFIGKFMELGYTKKAALEKYKYMNAKHEGQLQFR